MKDVYDPDEEDVLAWVSAPNDGWPASDWDYYVMNGKNDDLVFQFANDPSCSKNEFFLHALYYLVGDHYNEKQVNKEKHNRVISLLNKVNDRSEPAVQEWKKLTVSLLAGDLAFDTSFWFHYMFRNDSYL